MCITSKINTIYFKKAKICNGSEWGQFLEECRFRLFLERQVTIHFCSNRHYVTKFQSLYLTWNVSLRPQCWQNLRRTYILGMLRPVTKLKKHLTIMVDFTCHRVSLSDILQKNPTDLHAAHTHIQQNPQSHMPIWPVILSFTLMKKLHAVCVCVCVYSLPAAAVIQAEKCVCIWEKGVRKGAQASCSIKPLW